MVNSPNLKGKALRKLSNFFQRIFKTMLIKYNSLKEITLRIINRKINNQLIKNSLLRSA